MHLCSNLVNFTFVVHFTSYNTNYTPKVVHCYPYYYMEIKIHIYLCCIEHTISTWLSKQVHSLFGWWCEISHIGVGNISSKRRWDYNGKTNCDTCTICWKIYYVHPHTVQVCDFYSAPVGERIIAISLSVCLCICLYVCLSASISLELLDRSSQNFLCRSPVAMAQYSLVVWWYIMYFWFMDDVTFGRNGPYGD